MTVTTGVRKGSEILDAGIKTDFITLKQNLENLISVPESYSYALQISAQIEELLLEADKVTDSNNFSDLNSKSEKLLTVSRLSLQLSEFSSQSLSQRLIEFSRLTESFGRRTEVYAVLLSAFSSIVEAEVNKSLSVSEQFKRYALGFEMLASLIESRWQFLSIEVLKQIEISADAALKIELESRQIINHRDNPEFTEFAKSMRRSVTSVLWMIDRLEESKEIEGLRTLKHSLTPFMKHLAATREEQIEKNRGAIKWIEEQLKEAQQNQPTSEDIEEYLEISKILKREE